MENDIGRVAKKSMKASFMERNINVKFKEEPNTRRIRFRWGTTSSTCVHYDILGIFKGKKRRENIINYYCIGK